MAEKQGTGARAESRDDRGLERSSGRGSRTLAARRDPSDVFGSGPFALMRRMQDDFDRLFGGIGIGRRWPALFDETRNRDWMPAIEVFQRGDELVVRADVPGLSREDLTVEVGDDALTICGERKEDHEEQREGVFASERSYGSFCRIVPLPEGAVTDNAKANFKDGVLEIVVPTPPQEVRRGRRIEIEQEGSRRSQEKAARENK